jgi:hypothetical protein
VGVYPDREHFIPLRVADLIDALGHGAGPAYGQRLTPADGVRFRRFAKAAERHVHAYYLDQLRRLKDAYAPFDPDADTRRLYEPSDIERAVCLGELFDVVNHLLTKANYVRLSREELIRVMQGASDWGVDMDVCWDAFDHLDVFVRGRGFGKRTRRPWYKLFRREEVTVPTFGRVVVALKQRPHPRVGAGADTRSVFLKLFKDIPRMDVEMLLPATRVKMPWLDRCKLGGSVTSSVAYVGWKLSAFPVSGLSAALFGGGLLGLMTLYSPLALLVGYGYKTYYSFQVQQQTYQLQLTQSLYYQNLDNNAGVLYRILDEAEEQELREVILAYFCLWRYAGEEGWTAAQLDDYVELELERTLDTKVDFEIEDALAKLERIGAVVRVGDRYTAVPIDEATARLDGRVTEPSEELATY